MRSVLVPAFLILLAAPLHAADPLADARRLYNQGQYDAAERAARDAFRIPASAEGARVVLGRIQLERYRHSSASTDLAEAIAMLTAVDTRRLDARERIELLIGLAEALYLEDRFGAAAALFESALDRLDDARPGGARPRARLVGHGGRSAGADAPGRRAPGPLRADH